ncbi:MAG: hypothetical protein ACKPKO_53140, partial [Candidatus Fonsibacter sp.]
MNDNAIPSEQEAGVDQLGGIELHPGDEMLSDDDSPTTRRSLREEANTLYHLLTHQPKNPYCESCRRAKMK